VAASGRGERARDHVEDVAHSEAVTPPLEAVDGVAAELERRGLVADQKRDYSLPDQVDGALVAERGAELPALAQAGAGLFGVGLGDRRAHGEQAGGDEGRGAGLAGQRECLTR